MRRILVLLSGMALAGCLQQVDPQAPEELQSQSNQEGSEELSSSQIAFSNSLHPIIAANCADCHGDDQAPLFAYSSDIKLSHDNLNEFSLVDLSAPDASRLVAKVASNHHCWTGDCAADAQTLADAISEWVAESSDDSEGSSADALVSNEFVIDESLPACDPLLTESQQIVMALAFSGAPEGTVAGFQICEFGPNSYLAFNLKLKSSQDLKVKKPQIRINGAKLGAGGNDWLIVDTTVPGNGGDLFAPATLLSPSQIIIEKGFGLADASEGGNGKDKVSIAFEELEPVN